MFGNLNDTLFAHTAAIQVTSDGNLVGTLGEVKYIDHFEKAFGRYVVEYGAIFNGCDFQMFIFLFHDSLFICIPVNML